jgi:hypothetical protein
MTLWYLASPYTKYKSGHEIAYRDVCAMAAALVKKGYAVFSPIAHGHGLSKHGGIPFTDHAVWEKIDSPFVDLCGGLIVAKLDGWDNSEGVAVEISKFRAAGKPIIFMDALE